MSLWKASFASRETPWDVWVLSFPSTGQLVGLSRSVRGSEHYALNLASSSSRSANLLPPHTLSRSHLESNKLTAQSGFHGWWSLNAQCSMYSVLGSDVVTSWNAASPSPPSFLHRFRLSSEQSKSSTVHIFGAKHVGLSKILRHGLEKSRQLTLGRCWRCNLWLFTSCRILLFSAHGARPSNGWWTCHIVRASCCCKPDSPLGGGGLPQCLTCLL